MSNKQFRKVNASLGRTPSFGPIPAECIVPWSLISATLFYLSKVCNLSNEWTITIVSWGIATWWVLTGNKPWKFLAKFVGTPYWVKGYGRYQRLLKK